MGTVALDEFATPMYFDLTHRYEDTEPHGERTRRTRG
jgi:hypothetical protein